MPRNVIQVNGGKLVNINGIKCVVEITPSIYGPDPVTQAMIDKLNEMGTDEEAPDDNKGWSLDLVGARQEPTAQPKLSM